MPQPRINITEEDLTAIDRAAQRLRESQPELAALSRDLDPQQQARLRVKTIAFGVCAGLLALILILVVVTLVGAVLAAVFVRVFHLIS